MLQDLKEIGSSFKNINGPPLRKSTKSGAPNGATDVGAAWIPTVQCSGVIFWFKYVAIYFARAGANRGLFAANLT